MALRKKALENTLGKGENDVNQHFLLFPQCFLPNQGEKSSFQQHLFCRLQILSILTALKFCCFVKSLKALPYSLCITELQTESKLGQRGCQSREKEV